MISNNFNYKKLNLKNYNVPSFDRGIKRKDDYCQDFGSCFECYNFDTTTGALTDGMGFENLDFFVAGRFEKHNKALTPPGLVVRRCYYLRPWMSSQGQYYSVLILQMGNGVFVYNRLDLEHDTQFHTIEGLVLIDNPKVIKLKVNGSEVALFYAPTETMYMWDFISTSATEVANFPEFTSAISFNNKLFLTPYHNHRVVLYSDCLNPLNYNADGDDFGYINMNDEFGGCNKVIVFKNDLYCIKDYNIVKITPTADKKIFNCEPINVNNSLIVAGSATVCDDVLVYLASDGLYEFNGTRSTKIDFDLDDLIYPLDNKYAVGSYMNGYYYLCTRAEFKDSKLLGIENNVGEFYNNVLMKINLKTKECICLRGAEFILVEAVKDEYNSKMLCIYELHHGTKQIGIINMKGNNKDTSFLEKKWESLVSDFGVPDRYKYISHINLISKSNVDLILNLDDKVFTYKITGKNKNQKIRINRKAKRISFAFKTDSFNTYISNVSFCIGVL